MVLSSVDTVTSLVAPVGVVRSVLVVLGTPGLARVPEGLLELVGGPGDGTRVPLKENREYRIFETRCLCDDKDHTEVRVHAYDLNGSYLGSSPWIFRRHA